MSGADGPRGHFLAHGGWDNDRLGAPKRGRDFEVTISNHQNGLDAWNIRKKNPGFSALFWPQSMVEVTVGPVKLLRRWWSPGDWASEWAALRAKDAQSVEGWTLRERDMKKTLGRQQVWSNSCSVSVVQMLGRVFSFQLRVILDKKHPWLQVSPQPPRRFVLPELLSKSLDQIWIEFYSDNMLQARHCSDTHCGNCLCQESYQ